DPGQRDAALADPNEQPFDLREGHPVRLGHEDGQLLRVDDVAVESDVDGIGALERTVDVLTDADRGDELDLGWIEVARPYERDGVRVDRAAVEQHAQGHAPLIAGRGRLRRVQIAVRVEPHEPEPVVPRREAFNRTDV